jgi:hypothetical protein
MPPLLPPPPLPSLIRLSSPQVWFLLNTLGVPSEGDTFLDWGAGTGKQLWAAFFFARVRLPMIAAEEDEQAYGHLLENLKRLFVFLKADENRFLVEKLGFPDVATWHGDSATVGAWRIAAEPAPDGGAASSSSSSATLRKGKQCSLAIQYDGGPPSYDQNGDPSLPDHWEPVMRGLLTEPAMKAIVCTKMDQKLFDWLVTNREMKAGEWRHFVIVNSSQQGSHYFVHVWIRKNSLTEIAELWQDSNYKGNIGELMEEAGRAPKEVKQKRVRKLGDCRSHVENQYDGSFSDDDGDSQLALTRPLPKPSALIASARALINDPDALAYKILQDLPRKEAATLGRALGASLSQLAAALDNEDAGAARPSPPQPGGGAGFDARHGVITDTHRSPKRRCPGPRTSSPTSPPSSRTSSRRRATAT